MTLPRCGQLPCEFVAVIAISGNKRLSSVAVYDCQTNRTTHSYRVTINDNASFTTPDLLRAIEYYNAC